MSYYLEYSLSSCILTSQMNSFIYEVSILIFFTVELNTDYANIQKMNSFAKSVYTDDSDIDIKYIICINKILLELITSFVICYFRMSC